MKDRNESCPVMEISMLTLCLKTGLCLCLHQVERHIYTILFNMVILCFKTCLRLVSHWLKTFLHNAERNFCTTLMEVIFFTMLTKYEGILSSHLKTQYLNTLYTRFGDCFTSCVKTWLQYVWRHVYTIYEDKLTLCMKTYFHYV